MNQDRLKNDVRQYWNAQACGTGDRSIQDTQKYSQEYFDCIEENRYRTEPEIFSFAQFSRYHGKKVLEVGVGAGTDFIQWVRSGAHASGVDLTTEAVDHVQKRLALSGLNAEDVRVADAEHLPFDNNHFDLVYSWGVIHHSPDTLKALSEIVRVVKTGGECKIMLYNRYSLVSYFFWIRFALLAGRPWKSPTWCLAHYMESSGTKAYTVAEVKAMAHALPIETITVQPVLTYYDRLEGYDTVYQWIARMMAMVLGGDRMGWFLLIKITKKL